MTRKKVKLAYITNDSSRKATFKKRKKGLMKKVSELITLCGIDACAIIYSPFESQPDLWPNAIGVQRVTTQFRRMPEMEQTKKMVNQESYTRQRIIKVNELLKKQLKENRELEIIELMYQCLIGGLGLQNLAFQDLNDLGWILDHKLKEINKKCESLKKVAHDHDHDQQVSQPSHPPPRPTHEPHMIQVGENHEFLLRGVEGGQMSRNLSLDFDMGRGNMFGQPSNLGLGLSIDALHRPQCFTDWMNNPNEHMGLDDSHGGHDNGGEMMMAFNNNLNNTHWSSAFFP